MTSNKAIPDELFYCRLHEKAITDPYEGLKQFFDGEDIHEIRSGFDRMKEALLTESFGEYDSGNKSVIIHFLNRLEILYESGYILHSVRQNLES